jgi:hypothetical protein
MLASLSRSSALALVVSLGIVTPSSAWADDDDDDDEEGGFDSGEEEDEDPEDEKDQPAITAGGLYTLKTFPIRELFRPLTITQGITQIRASLGSDVSDKTAFQYFGVSLEARHGYRDNFMLLGGFTSDYNFKGFSISAGFEGALAYDLFDIRLQANLNRVAQADPMKFVESGNTVVPTEFQAGAGVQLSVDLGFPFRYVATKEVAIVALETLISIDFNSITRGRGPQPGFAESCFAIPNAMTMVDTANCTEDGAKPDLAPSIGIATNPIAPLSVVLFAQLQIRDFDTTNQFTIPATARVQYSPNQKLDIGLEFKFQDLKPKDPDGDGVLEPPAFFAQRFLNLFIQARY